MSWLASDESEVQDFGVAMGRGHARHPARPASDDHYLIEAELAVEPRLPDGIGMVRSMSDRLSGQRSARLAEQAMRQLDALTGFDRLMLCDRDGAIVASGHRSGSSFRRARWSVDARARADRRRPRCRAGADDRRRASELLDARRLPGPRRGRSVRRLTALGIARDDALPLRIDGRTGRRGPRASPPPRRCGAERRRSPICSPSGWSRGWRAMAGQP